MDRRRILIAIGFAGFIALVGVGIYFVFFRRAAPPAPPPPPPELVPVNVPPLLPTVPVAPPTALVPPTGVPRAPPGAPPPAPSAVATGGVTAVRAVAENPAAFLRIGSDGRPNFYDSVTGRFYRIGADGKPTPLTDRTFARVRSVAWDPRGERAILEFPDGANVLYDFRTNTQVTLPAHWQDFSFDPDGSRIAGKSIGLDRENRWLFSADPDGNNYQGVEALGSNANRVTVAWSPNNQVIAFSRTGTTIGDERQQIVAVGLHGENFPGLVVEGVDFRPLWSPTGSRILYSAVHSSSDYRPELWVTDGSGDAIGSNRRRLLVHTWADKCAFANDTTLYCAVPTQLPRGYGLERALADRIPDAIERIDLATGTRAAVGTPAVAASMRDLTLSADGRTLFYTSAQDGRLYELKLQ